MRNHFSSKSNTIGLGVALALLGLLMSTVLAQAIARDAELARRGTCAANLRGIAQSMIVYAADNSDVFPLLIPSSATTYDVTMKEDKGAKDPDATIENLYKAKKYSNNPSANLWLMVLTGQVAPKQFICKSDPFAGTPAAASLKDGEYYSNFQDSKNISYSSIFPWTEKDNTVICSPVWKDPEDASLVILSDMAPFLGKNGKPDEVATRPWDPASTQAAVGSAPASAPSPDSDWAVKKANSQNHQFEGQNVAFADSHTVFVKRPDVGHSNLKVNDSIWGIEKDPEAMKSYKIDEEPIEAGKLPHAPTGMTNFWDVVMVPTRDAKGNLK